MKYTHITSAVFESRPNRFIADVRLDGQRERVHVKNTGRCRELLIPGCTVYLSRSDVPTRSTRYDLIAVEKQCSSAQPLLINMDSQIPNGVAEEYLRRHSPLGEGTQIRREVRFGNSRFDFYLENGGRKAFLEVKGVTLEEDSIALFPDAPTQRGVKHLRELIACVEQGYEAYVLFVIQMKGPRVLRSNDRTDPTFGQALREACRAGVRLMAVDCIVHPDSIRPDAPVPVEL